MSSGHAAGLRRLQELGWRRLNVSISLNAAMDAKRSQIMPSIADELAALQKLLQDYRPRKNFTLGVNYCLLPGINDGEEDLSAIALFCEPLGRVLLQVIPYNPGTEPLTRAPTEDEVVAFVAGLRAHGLPVRRRITKGRSIMAACGQLGDKSQRNSGRRQPSAAS